MHPTGHDLDSWLLAFTEAADVVELGSLLVYDLSRGQKKGDHITGTV